MIDLRHLTHKFKLFRNGIAFWLLFGTFLTQLYGQVGDHGSHLQVAGTCHPFTVQSIQFYDDVPLLLDVEKPFPSPDLHWHVTERFEPNTIGYRSTQSKPVAHVKAEPLKMKVAFEVSPEVQNISVDVYATTEGTALKKYDLVGAVGASNQIPCMDGRCPGSGFADFIIQKTPDNVDINTVELVWSLSSVNGEIQYETDKHQCNTSHRIYSLFGKPVSPMETPPATVLELVLNIVRNKNVRSEVLEEIRSKMKLDILGILPLSHFRILDVNQEIESLAKFAYTAYMYLSEFENERFYSATFMTFSLKTYLKELTTQKQVFLQCSDMASVFKIFTAALGVDNIQFATIFCKKEIKGTKEYLLWKVGDQSSIPWRFHCTPVDVTDAGRPIVYDPIFDLPFGLKNCPIDFYMETYFRGPKLPEILKDLKYYGFSKPEYHIISEGITIQENNKSRWRISKNYVAPDQIVAGKRNVIEVQGVGLGEDVEVKWFIDGSCNEREDVKTEVFYMTPIGNQINAIIELPMDINCTTAAVHLTKASDQIPVIFEFRIVKPDGLRKASNLLSIVPNPADGYTNLSLESQRRQISLIQLVNISGNIILESSHELYPGLNEIRLAWTAQAPGLYNVKVFIDGHIITKPLSIK